MCGVRCWQQLAKVRGVDKTKRKGAWENKAWQNKTGLEQEVRTINDEGTTKRLKAINEMMGLEAWEREKKLHEGFQNSKWKKMLDAMCMLQFNRIENSSAGLIESLGSRSLEIKARNVEGADKLSSLQINDRLGLFEDGLLAAGKESQQHFNETCEQEDGPPPGFPIAKYGAKAKEIRRSPRLAKKSYVRTAKEKKEKIKLVFQGRTAPIGAQLAINLITQSSAEVTDEIKKQFLQAGSALLTLRAGDGELEPDGASI